MGLDVRDLLARDFSDSGKCNYYTTKDTFLQAPIVLLIQVIILASNEQRTTSNQYYTLQKESAFTKHINRLILASQEMGFMGRLFSNNVRNSTECQTWQQEKESHRILGEQGEHVSFRVANQ